MNNFIILFKGSPYFYQQWTKRGNEVFGRPMSIIIEAQSLEYISSGMTRTQGPHNWFIELNAESYHDVLAATQIMEQENWIESVTIIERLGDLKPDSDDNSFTRVFQNKLASMNDIYNKNS